jgi:hypothetical protein
MNTLIVIGIVGGGALVMAIIALVAKKQAQAQSE